MTRFNIEDVISAKQNGQCLRKFAYYKRRYAEERAQATTRETGSKCRVYKCQYCNMYHVTSSKHEDSNFRKEGTQRH